MANIRENKKNGKTVSYRFTVCLERDAQGKQVRKYTTWTPPEGLTPAKAKRAAERAAEESVFSAYGNIKQHGQCIFLCHTMTCCVVRNDFIPTGINRDTLTHGTSSKMY